jgi:hypothetical protein
MSRLLILCSLALALLFGCGQVITINFSGTTPSAQSYADGALPQGYERFLSPATWNFRYSWPGEPVRRGEVSERYELRDGDCADADCTNGRLRAEIRELQTAPTAHVGKDIWYGWSFYNDNIGTVIRDQSVGTVIGQWKLDGNSPAVFRIVQTYTGELDWTKCSPAYCNPLGSPTEDVVAELENMHVSAHWGAAQNFGDVCRLFSMAENRGKWVDIVVNSNFAANEDGYLRIWINGVMRCNYYGRMVAGTPFGLGGAPLSHRRGLFASYTKPWRDKQNGAAIPTMVAYYDEFRSGSSRGDVDPAARESGGLRPKD